MSPSRGGGSPQQAPLPPQQQQQQPAASVDSSPGQAGDQVANTSEGMTNVRVAVRARPLLPREITAKCQECVVVQPDKALVSVGRRRYNATVFAYGQTGSGKTYTMGSGNNVDALEHEIGILPRVIRMLFDQMDENKEVDFLIRCAYLEIHNEEIRDLLHPDTPSKAITIREDAGGEIFVVGIREQVVTGYEDMCRCLEHGSSARTTGSTLMNEQSSRSHAIFTITLEQRMPPPEAADSGYVEYITAKFHLVDLAGSERNKRTGAVGARFKESVNINSGLLALGNVISALGDERKRGTHVPYRESKLTRMLQDSLGGNSRTCMLACVSTADVNFEETLNTLKYANRARNIKNKPVINRDPHQAQLMQLRGEIKVLQLELLRHRRVAAGEDQPNGLSESELLQSAANQQFLGELKLRTLGINIGNSESDRYIALQAECISLRQLLQAATVEVGSLSEETLELKAERDHFKLKLEELGSQLDKVLTTVVDLEYQKQLSHAACQQIFNAAEARQTSANEASVSYDKQARKEFTIISPTELRGSIRADEHEGRQVIQQYLRTIRELEQKVAKAEEHLAEKEVSLREAKEDLARDEIIFAEKVKEIKRLEELAKDQSSTPASRHAESHAGQSVAISTTDLPLDASIRDEDLPSPRSPRPADGMSQFEPGGVSTSAALANAVESDDEVKLYDVLSQYGDDPSTDMEERERLLREKEAIEQEKQRVEAQAQQQEQEFMRRQHAMEKQLRDLSFNITQKESLIQDLTKNELEAKLLSQQYEARMRELEQEVQNKEDEVERLRQELDGLDNNLNKGEEERRKLREAYEEKVRKVQVQLAGLKRVQHDQQTTRVAQGQAKSDVKVQSLESELARMRAQQDALRRKIKDNTERFEDLHEGRAKEIATLKKEAETSAKRVRELESENEKQKLLFRKKSEEAALAQKRLKELEDQDNRDLRPQVRGITPSRRAGSAAGLSHAENGHAARPISAPAGVGKSADPSKVRPWLEKEIDKLLSYKNLADQLDRQLKLRAEIVSEKELRTKERANLELKKLRASKVVASELDDAAKQCEDLEHELETYEREMAAAEATRAQHALEAARRKAQVYRSQLDEVRHRKMALEKAQQGDKLLDPRDEETLVVYVVGSINGLQKQLANSTTATQSVRERLDTMSLAETKSILKKYIEVVVEVRDRERRTQDHACDLQLHLEEKSRLVEQMQHSLKIKEMEFDRRVTDLEKEQARKVQYLLKQINAVTVSTNKLQLAQRTGPPTSDSASSPLPSPAPSPAPFTQQPSFDTAELQQTLQFKEEQIRILDKDNFYYKQTNRELKRKLRELMAAADSERQAIVRSTEQQHARLLELENSNAVLLAELQALKGHDHRRKSSAVRSPQAARGRTGESAKHLPMSPQLRSPRRSRPFSS
eukprot:jgi/Chlat1/489/Chrsp103S01091